MRLEHHLVGGYVRYISPHIIIIIIINEARHFKDCFLCYVNLSIIMEIINIQMRHYLHNRKGYRALPYTKLKLMLCALQPSIKLNF